MGHHQTVHFCTAKGENDQGQGSWQQKRDCLSTMYLIEDWYSECTMVSKINQDNNKKPT